MLTTCKINANLLFLEQPHHKSRRLKPLSRALSVLSSMTVWEFWWQTIQHAEFGTLPLFTQFLAPQSPGYTCVSSLPHHLPKQANFFTLNGNQGTAGKMVYSQVTLNRQDMNTKCIQFDSLHSSQHYPAIFLGHFAAPNSLLSLPSVTRHTSSVACYKKPQLSLFWEL